ncbi:thioredoxin family protein [Ancylomarina sp.]|uniref:thioredoxin family protein n=1 Tax=Ancylomarina sp. TaxID=1970196 RepID=UPI003566BAA8
MRIQSLTEIEKLRKQEVSFCIYFSSPNCGVCQVLKPKIMSLMKDYYPEIQTYKVDVAVYPEIAAQMGFYTNPSFIVYLNGQEYLRRSRSISLQELYESLARPYKLMF